MISRMVHEEHREFGTHFAPPWPLLGGRDSKLTARAKCAKLAGTLRGREHGRGTDARTADKRLLLLSREKKVAKGLVRVRGGRRGLNHVRNQGLCLKII